MTTTFKSARWDGNNFVITAQDGREYSIGEKTSQLARGGICLTPRGPYDTSPPMPLTLKAVPEWGADDEQPLRWGTNDPQVGALAVLATRAGGALAEGPYELPPRAAAEKIVQGWVREWIEEVGNRFAG